MAPRVVPHFTEQAVLQADRWSSAARAARRIRQCDIRAGTVIELKIPLVAPPSTNSRRREWP
jgi:hypothetical protein